MNLFRVLPVLLAMTVFGLFGQAAFTTRFFTYAVALPLAIGATVIIPGRYSELAWKTAKRYSWRAATAYLALLAVAIFASSENPDLLGTIAHRAAQVGLFAGMLFAFFEDGHEKS